MKHLGKKKYERHCLILDEKDVMNVLRVIHKHHHKSVRLSSKTDMVVGECGWKDHNKWFVRFTTTESVWVTIRSELRIVRVWNIRDIPKGNIDDIYTTD